MTYYTSRSTSRFLLSCRIHIMYMDIRAHQHAYNLCTRYLKIEYNALVMPNHFWRATLINKYRWAGYTNYKNTKNHNFVCIPRCTYSLYLPITYTINIICSITVCRSKLWDLFSYISDIMSNMFIIFLNL